MPYLPSLSLPVWGEWIEIFLRGGIAPAPKSLPVWGEWIEINIEQQSAEYVRVSPRVGRVD